MALLGLAVVTAFPQIGFAQSNPFVGTWQLNLAKSKYSPGPPPKSQTENVQAEGQGLTGTVTGVGAEGNPISNRFTTVEDGMPHPVRARNYDVQALTRVDPYTVIGSGTKDGKLVEALTLAVSPDGKTLNITLTGINANGRPINNIEVFDKQ